MKKTISAVLLFLSLFSLIFSQESKAEYVSPVIGKLVYIPGGTFTRSPIMNKSDDTNSVLPFRMSKFEITRKQFKEILGYDPSDSRYSSSENDPVQNVNWYAAIVFCNALSLAEGLEPVYAIRKITKYEEIPQAPDPWWENIGMKRDANGYRLPSSSEWLWAALEAQDKKDRSFSGSNGTNKPTEYAIFGYSSFKKDRLEGSKESSSPVGSKKSNSIGLHDMSGNVKEWCWDYSISYISGPLIDFYGPNQGKYRIVQGSSWSTPFNELNLTFIDSGYDSFYKDEKIGFRVVRN